MADGLNVPVQEMDRWLREIRAQDEPIARRALTFAGEAIVSEAQYAAPVKTGVLKESHGVTSFGRGADGRFGSTGKSITMFANTSYALARHEVFPDKPGHQWFARAIAEHAPRLLEGGLKIALRDAGAQRA